MFTLFGVKCRIVKIYLEDVYDIFYHKSFVYISIAHTIYISLKKIITLFKFYKNVCKEMYTNHCLFFLLVLVDINLNHNVILYFFITLLILYW
jgi:hypothetical protein